MILVGTKLDLREDPKERQRLADRRMTAITYAQGAQCAREIGAIKYLEVRTRTRARNTDDKR